MTEEKKETALTSLATAPIVTPEFGKSLIDATLEKARKTRAARVVDGVTEIIAKRDTAREWEKNNRVIAEKCESQLRAIEAGEFELVGTRIKFNDKKLNEADGHTVVIDEEPAEEPARRGMFR